MWSILSSSSVRGRTSRPRRAAVAVLVVPGDGWAGVGLSCKHLQKKMDHEWATTHVAGFGVLFLITLWFGCQWLIPPRTPPATQPPPALKPVAKAKSSRTDAELLRGLSGLPVDRLAKLCAELVEAEPRLLAHVDAALAVRYPMRPAPIPSLPFELTEVCGIAAMPNAPILCMALTEGDR